jgi:hypothetical protein
VAHARSRSRAALSVQSLHPVPAQVECSATRPPLARRAGPGPGPACLLDQHFARARITVRRHPARMLPPSSGPAGRPRPRRSFLPHRPIHPPTAALLVSRTHAKRRGAFAKSCRGFARARRASAPRWRRRRMVGHDNLVMGSVRVSG